MARKNRSTERTLHPLPTVTRNAEVEARVANRLDELAASAVDRYVERCARGKENVLDEIVALGVRSHAHAWCFDLLGTTWASLAHAGCVFLGWRPRADEYWEVVGLKLSGRRIEIYMKPSGSIEVSVTYTESETERLSEGLRRRQ